MTKIKLYQLKKGDHFREINENTGEPDGPVYIKGKPHTIVGLSGKTQTYATFIYAPGEPYDRTFTGYVDCDSDVVKVFD